MSVTSAELIKLVIISSEKQNEYLASLTGDEKSARGEISDWSPKDIMAHIIYWNADTAGILAGLDRQDDSETGAGVDHINADVWQQYRHVTWTEVNALVKQVNRDLLESLKDIDEDQLNDTQRYEWTNGRPLWQQINFRCFYHPLQHIADLVAKRGELAQANEIHEEITQVQLALMDSDTWRGNVIYNLGCHYAITGQKEKAVQNIVQAVKLYPYLKEWAPQDSDLDSLRDDPEIMALL